MLSTLVVWALSVFPDKAGGEVTIEPSDGGLSVSVDGLPFAGYLTRSGGQPVVWPVIGPTEAEYTRSYPLGERMADENNDHPHHRSLWFAHGDVNGHDFWHGTFAEPSTMIRHSDFLEVADGERQGKIVSRNDWIARSELILEDKRTLVFGADEQIRWIDFSIELIASNGDVHFGDTKEGTFAVRVAGSMKVDPPGQGRIVNSLGRQNAKAWGIPSPWVDYHGPVRGETVGIAVLSHPSSFRHPCRWHVRPYGLFAANPFGEAEFPSAGVKQGAVTIPDGQSICLSYRVLLHQGDETEGRIADRYAQFVSSSVAAEPVRP